MQNNTRLFFCLLAGTEIKVGIGHEENTPICSENNLPRKLQIHSVSNK